MRISKDMVCVSLLSIHMLMLILNGTTFFSIGNRAYIYCIVIILEIIYLILISHSVSVSKFFDVRRNICLFMITYSFLSILFVNPNFQNDNFLAAVLFFLLLFFLDIDNYQQLVRLKKYYILSALILAIGILIIRYMPYPGLSRMTILTYTGEYYDVNFISAYISIPVILLVYDFFECKKRIIFFELLIMLIATLLTGSRTALGIQSIGFICILFKQRKITIKVLLVVMAMILMIPIFILLLPEDIIGHFSKGINLLNDSRRMLDWFYGVLLIMLKPLLGHGFVSSHDLIVENFGLTWVTVHNTYLVFLVNFGLVGGIPAILLLLLPVFRFIKYKAPYIYILAYGLFLISICIIEANFSDIMIIPICYFYLMAEHFKKNLHALTAPR